MGFFGKRLPPLPDDPALLLQMAREEKDALRQHEMLLKAEALAPEDLPVQRALLLLGELYKRDGRTPNVRLIKFYLFHIFEHPEAHSEEEQREMARELFDHPRLRKCMALSPEPNKFLREYLREMAENYMRVFIEGDASHGVRLLGVAFAGRREVRLARPMADVIRNILLCPFLSAEEQEMLSRVCYRVFYAALDGHTGALDGLLGPEICGLLA